MKPFRCLLLAVSVIIPVTQAVAQVIGNVFITDLAATGSIIVTPPVCGPSPHPPCPLSVTTPVIVAPAACHKPCKMHISLPLAALGNPNLVSPVAPGSGRDIRILDALGNPVRQILVQWPVGSNTIEVDFVDTVGRGNPVLSPAFAVTPLNLAESTTYVPTLGPIGVPGQALFNIFYSTLAPSNDQPPLAEPADGFVTLPPVTSNAPRPCRPPTSKNGHPPLGEIDEEESVTFDPSLAMPKTIDTTTDAWMAGCKDSFESENEDESLGAIASQIDASPEPHVPDSAIPPEGRLGFPLIKVPAPNAALFPEARASCALPFCGRDVILVHGFRTNPLGDFLAGEAAAQTTWPDNPAEFLTGGYWFEGAKQYWMNYVMNKLAPEYAQVAPGTRMPRVLFIAYPTTQRLKVASNAMLNQIAEAISNGTSVYTLTNNNGVLNLVPLTAANDPQPGKRFCALQCVIVSHSTGGPVTNVAMAEAFSYGVPLIPQAYIKAHIAIEPAFSGSNHATMGLAAALAIPSSPGGCVAWIGIMAFAFPEAVGGDVGECLRAKLLLNSIMVDLMPAVMATRWRIVINSSLSPVPTLILPAGHPTSMWPLMWAEKLFPGFNDNTLTMDSQLGRPWVLGNPHSNSLRVDRRRFVLDRANGGNWPLFLSSAKALGYYIDQIHPPSFSRVGTSASAAANPYLTPSGMHLNVFNIGNIPRNSVGLPNTFTFMQASASHFFLGEFSQRSPQSKHWENLTECHAGDSGPTSYNYHNAGPIAHTAVDEESRAIFDPHVYVPGPDGIPLVSASMKTAVEGTTVTLYSGKKQRGIIRWQRTYYLLKDWRCMDYLDYMHRFALRP